MKLLSCLILVLFLLLALKINVIILVDHGAHHRRRRRRRHHHHHHDMFICLYAHMFICWCHCCCCCYLLGSITIGTDCVFPTAGHGGWSMGLLIVYERATKSNRFVRPELWLWLCLFIWLYLPGVLFGCDLCILMVLYCYSICFYFTII